MRRIISSSFVSLDGVIGDPRAWAMQYFDDDSQEAALQRLLASDAMLMGRGTYEYFTDDPPQTGDYADRIDAIPKYVFSSTLESADWNNSTIVRGDVPSAVRELKQREGQDLLIYGHGQLGQTLLEHHLLDELHVAIHPVLVGHGQSLARAGQRTPLKLLATTELTTGVVVVSYQPAQA
jgi:dihydrofolate reductase